MRTLWQDIRFGLRMLAKSPGFTVVAVVALALGIGANTAIFSVVNAVLLRPLPYANSERLLWLRAVNPPAGINSSNISAPDFEYWKEKNDVFEGMAAFTTGGGILTGGDEPERVPLTAVTPGFFPMLGVKPSLGRTFSPEEELPDSAPAAVLSYSLWQRRFGADPKVIGSTQMVTGKSVNIVGVMPRGFEFPQRTEIWVAFTLDAGKERRDNRYLQGVARLKDGVTLEQAQAQVSTFDRQLAQQYVETNSGWDVQLSRLQDELVSGIRPALLLLLGAVLFVLLITCANVANLLLARAAARQREIALRTALGASRLRIIRQLLTESLLLSALGGTLGLLLSVWLTDILIAISPANTPRFNEIGVDGRVLAFTLAVTCLVGIVFGLAPALQSSKTDLNEALKEGGRGGGAETGGRNRLRRLLVVSEVALSLMLLVGAGLLIKSFARLQEVHPGFNPEHVLTMRISVPSNKYKEKAQRAEFFRRLMEQVAALPGAEAAGATLSLPLGGSNFSVGRSIIREGKPLSPEEASNAAYVVTAGDYFRAMQIPLKGGRVFTERDAEGAPPVVIINETLARRSFAGEDPLGKKIRVWRDEEFMREIVGVVGDTKPAALEGESGAQIYVPQAQDAGWGGMSLAVRTSVEPASLAPSVRSLVRALDKDQPVFDIKTMDDVVSISVADRRVSMLLLSVFAGAAMLLAAVGLYGVISYTVTQRTHEIGIRMALGAQTRDVFRMVVGQGVTMALVGVLVGVAGAFVLTRVMSNMLFGVSATDPLVFVGVSLLLVFVALLACCIPARRATKVDPMVALRYE